MTESKRLPNHTEVLIAKLPKGDGSEEDEAPVFHRMTPGEGAPPSLIPVSPSPDAAPPTRRKQTMPVPAGGRGGTMPAGRNPASDPRLKAAAAARAAASDPSIAMEEREATRFVAPNFEAMIEASRAQMPERQKHEGAMARVEAIVRTADNRIFRLRGVDASEQGVVLGCAAGKSVPIAVGTACAVRLVARHYVVDMEAELVKTEEAPHSPETRQRLAFRTSFLTRDQQQALHKMVAAVHEYHALPFTERHKRAIYAASAALALVAVIAVLVALRPRPIPLPVVAVGTSTIDETVQSIRAEVVPAQRQVVRSSFDQTRPLQITVKVGDHLKEGDVIARAQSSKLEGALTSARRELVSAEDRAQKLEADAARLAASGRVDPQLVSDARDAAARARAVAARHQKDSQEITKQIKETLVVAPFDGVVADILVQSGDPVAPSTPVLELIDTSHFRVEATFHEASVARVTVGQMAAVWLAGQKTAMQGKIESLSDVVRNETRGPTVRTTIALPGSAPLRAGGTATVSITLEQRENVTTLPASAVRRDGARMLVFVVDAKGRGGWREVQTGFSDPSRVEILGGVSIGETVSANGGLDLNPQALYRPML